MRPLLNTLYVTSSDAYLSLDGENVVVLKEDQPAARVPLHNLEGIVTFGYTGASPALMGACAQRGIALSFMAQNGHFLARVSGEVRGNILLRKTQYRWSEEEARSALIARNFILGKVYNARWVLERATRDYALRVNVERLKGVSQNLAAALPRIVSCEDLQQLRGYEGEAASQYFGVFDELILQQKESFSFRGRNKRPALDPVNALLSFVYTLLAHEVASALETVGLDPYAGFLHRDRPGRISLALDLMEELRPVFADRFVLSLINKKMVAVEDFVKKEDGALLLQDDARRTLLGAWQERKQDTILHPYLQEKIEWGLVPHVQALLLARYLRGDLDAYPPFLWK